MAGTYSDNLEFNSEQLQAQIGIMENVRDMMVSAKEKYMDYISQQLSPNWTTENGQKTVNELLNYAETDIQSFINYLNNRIEDLTVSQQKTVQIDQS